MGTPKNCPLDEWLIVVQMRKELTEYLQDCITEAYQRSFNRFTAGVTEAFEKGADISALSKRSQQEIDSIYDQANDKLMALYEMSDEGIKSLYAKTFGRTIPF